MHHDLSENVVGSVTIQFSAGVVDNSTDELGTKWHRSLYGLAAAADDMSLVSDSVRLLLRSADRTCVTPRTQNTFSDKSFTAADLHLPSHLLKEPRLRTNQQSNKNISV